MHIQHSACKEMCRNSGSSATAATGHGYHLAVKDLGILWGVWGRHCV